MSEPLPPAPSPRPPNPDAAPLSLDKTPSHFPVTAEYVRRKLQERDTEHGKPVVSKKLTPWFFAGYTLCGAVTAVVVGDPSVPGWLVKTAAIGALFFGGLLGISTGWRK
jgi:hypothetical protein